MPEMVDASTLSDPKRVRRSELAAAHTAALRSGDKDELAQVTKEIKAEYADDVKAAAAAAAAVAEQEQEATK